MTSCSKESFFSLDGKKKIEVEKPFQCKNEKIRFYCAQEFLDNGGQELMKTIKINLKKCSQTSTSTNLTDENDYFLLMLIWILGKILSK
jgi:hypothetical protein